jgi:hypothetical protein
MLDIFNDDAFSVVNLTDALNETKHKPGFISSLGLFTETPVDTTTIAIEKGAAENLILVPRSARGGPGTTVGKNLRSMKSLNVPHFEINDAVMAEEVQGIRAFGQTVARETMQAKLATRFSEHQNSFAVTEEFARLGAVKGVVTYADGGTLDLFSEFGVSQEAELAFNFAVKDSGDLRKFLMQTQRTMGVNLAGLPFSGVLALCSDTAFDALLKNPEVYKSYMKAQDVRQVRQGYLQNAGDPQGGTWGVFEWGDWTWANYRGQVGTQKFIDDDKLHILPMGVPNMFRSYYAPADYEETVNTLGKRLYAKQYPMPNGKGRHLDIQTNALHICTRPKALMKGKLQA